MPNDYKNIIKDIKAGSTSPVYLLHGEESFFIDKIADAIESLVAPESKDFNLSLLYGEEVTPQNVMDHCRQYPMMAPFRVVLVREAQNLKGIAQLEQYIDHLVPTTILALSHKHKKVDGRTQFAKKVKKVGTVFESKRLYDNQIEGWIGQELRSRGVQFEPSVPAILSDHLGQDLSKIEGELDKVETNLVEGQSLNSEMIEKWVGISRSYNVFELQKAMSRGDVKSIMRIVNYFSQNTHTHHPLMIMASLYNYFSRLLLLGLNKRADQKTLMSKLKISSPYFLKEYQQALRFWKGKKVVAAFEILGEYDLKLKGYNTRRADAGELLKEMMMKMLLS